MQAPSYILILLLVIAALPMLWHLRSGPAPPDANPLSHRFPMFVPPTPRTAVAALRRARQPLLEASGFRTPPTCPPARSWLPCGPIWSRWRRTCATSWGTATRCCWQLQSRSLGRGEKSCGQPSCSWSPEQRQSSQGSGGSIYCPSPINVIVSCTES